MAKNFSYNKLLTDAVKSANADTSQYRSNWKPFRKARNPQKIQTKTILSMSIEQTDYEALKKITDPDLYVGGQVQRQLLAQAQPWLQSVLDDILGKKNGRSKK